VTADVGAGIIELLLGANFDHMQQQKDRQIAYGSGFM
jgi:hypothetical protein